MGKITAALREVVMPQQKRAEVIALDSEFVQMEAEIQALRTKLLHLEAQVNPLQREIERLKAQLKQQSSQATSINPLAYACDHCGSTNLKRTGSRANPTYGEVGIKDALFTCGACGKESAFIQEQ